MNRAALVQRVDAEDRDPLRRCRSIDGTARLAQLGCGTDVVDRDVSCRLMIVSSGYVNLETTCTRAPPRGCRRGSRTRVGMLGLRRRANDPRASRCSGFSPAECRSHPSCGRDDHVGVDRAIGATRVATSRPRMGVARCWRSSPRRDEAGVEARLKTTQALVVGQPHDVVDACAAPPRSSGRSSVVDISNSTEAKPGTVRGRSRSVTGRLSHRQAGDMDHQLHESLQRSATSQRRASTARATGRGSATSSGALASWRSAEGSGGDGRAIFAAGGRQVRAGRIAAQHAGSRKPSAAGRCRPAGQALVGGVEL